MSGWCLQTINDMLTQDCLVSGWYLQTVHDNKTPLNKLDEEKEEEEVWLFVVDVRSTTKLKSRRIQFIKTPVKAWFAVSVERHFMLRNWGERVGEERERETELELENFNTQG